MSPEERRSLLTTCNTILSSSISGLNYPNNQQTPLINISQSVTKKLLNRHCKDKAALAAAALGDLPFSESTLRKTIKPAFGAKVANAWKEMHEVKTYRKKSDCLEDCTGLNMCHDKACVRKRLETNAPRMSGSARAALMAWFSTLSAMVSGEDYPRNWTLEDR